MMMIIYVDGVCTSNIIDTIIENKNIKCTRILSNIIQTLQNISAGIQSYNRTTVIQRSPVLYKHKKAKATRTNNNKNNEE